MDSVQVAAGVWKIRLGQPEAVTPVGARQSAVQQAALAALPAVAAPPLPLDRIRFRTAARGCVVTLPYDREEGIYGFGLQLKSHLQCFKKKTLRVNSDPVADAGDSHAPVPFYVSTAGYGVLVDTCRYAAFYVGAHVDLPELRAFAEHKWAHMRDEEVDLFKLDSIGTRVVVDVPVARGVDVYLFAGPSLRTAVQRYVLFSGGGCLPPMWGLGGWYRAHMWFTADEALALARQLRDERIPCDVFGLEGGWQERFYPNSFTWSRDRFPEPAAFAARVHALGYRLNVWENGFVHPDAPLAAALGPRIGDETSTDGLVPDFMDPEARRAFAEHHDRVLVEGGIDGFKLDECDNSDFVFGPWSFPEHTQFPSGVDGEQMHSLLGLRYQETLDGIFRRRGRRHYGQARSSHALAAPQPFVLYSDLYHHPDFIRGMVNAGFSGLLWCPEVRHADSLEELVRRVQAVALSPQALINAFYCRHPPWFQSDARRNNADEPMPEQAQARDLVRQAFELRMRLLPYLYAAFARYRFEGLPPFRALVMDYPEDRAAYRIEDQWLIGAALLAAPFVVGRPERNVYLPPGAWYEFHTGARREGGRSYPVPNELARIPLYVREGAVLPLAEPVLHVADDTVFRITPTVYGRERAEGWLYEDDGVSYRYEQGERAFIHLEWTRAGGLAVRREGSSPVQRYALSECRQMG